MFGENDKCNFSNQGGTSSFPPDCLYSSQPKENCSVTSAEPSVGRSIPIEQPIVPPRNYQQHLINKTSSINTPFSTYNRYPYSAPRLPYSGYNYGYGSIFPYCSNYNSNMYGNCGVNTYNMNSHESRFIRAAEESTRPTFHAIESLTRAINSVAFMMESTFGSLNMSFQAILSVIENFSHARRFFKQLLASILTIRILQKFFNIVIQLLRKMNIISDQFVSNLTWLNIPAITTKQASSNVSMWPVFTFLGLMFGAPYLISKMLPQDNMSELKTDWDPSIDRFIQLVGVHDFQAANPQEVSFRRGQFLKMIPPEIMQPSSPYWVFVANENNQTGYVPRNHVAPS